MTDDDVDRLKQELGEARKQSMLETLKRARQGVDLQLRQDALADEVADAHRARVEAQQRHAAEVLNAAKTRGHLHRVEAELDASRDAHIDQLGVVAGAAAAQAVGAITAAPGPRLSSCFAAFKREANSKRTWSAKTADRWDVTMRYLIEHVGDRPVSEVRRDDMVAFLDRLRRLPANAQKKPGLKGKTFAELVAVEGHAVIRDQTVNDHMTRASGFFKWAVQVDEYRVTRNPAQGLAIGKPETTKRLPFTEAQLVALFTDKSWRDRRFLHPHRYWLIPIAILSGMRLNEICQLQLSDFIKVLGVDVICCAELGSGSKGKNDNATRRVPVHQDLLRLGLVRWVDRLRADGQTQLFPELKKGRDGHGQGPSKWFGSYRVRCGVLGKQVNVFHSFRNYFISERMNLEVLAHKLAAIVGHETKLVTGDVYWTDREVHSLLDGVVNVVGLASPVRELVPAIEDVVFAAPAARRPPSRLDDRKSREKRVADAAKRAAGLAK